MGKLIIGNWKMHGASRDLAEADAVAADLDRRPSSARVAICPSFVLLHRLAERMAGTAVAVGAQDVHPNDQGAHTGDVSAAMLHDAGASLAIIGHSERRSDHFETCDQVAAKVRAALTAELEPIVCLGETLQERREGRALEVVLRQARDSLPDALAGKAFAVAYEPIWAIGAGVTPSLGEIAEVHAALAQALRLRFPNTPPAPILYGGSVKPANAADILALAEVGGALVGAASLKASDFLAIIRAADAAVAR